MNVFIINLLMELMLLPSKFRLAADMRYGVNPSCDEAEKHCLCSASERLG